MFEGGGQAAVYRASRKVRPTRRGQFSVKFLKLSFAFPVALVDDILAVCEGLVVWLLR